MLCCDWLKWSLLVYREVKYKLSPARGWAGGTVMNEDKAFDWMWWVAVHVDAMYFEAVGLAVDHLRGVEWLNEVGRLARNVCRVVDIQNVVVVKEVRELMEDPMCIWLQVEVGGGG